MFAVIAATEDDDEDDVSRLRDWTARGVDSHRQWNLVVFHADSNLVVHGKTDLVSDNGADEVAHRVRGGPRQADGNQVRDAERWFHHDVLQGLFSQRGIA